MARKFDLITELYQQTQKRVTKPQEWQRVFVGCLPQLQAFVR